MDKDSKGQRKLDDSGGGLSSCSGRTQPRTEWTRGRDSSVVVC